MPLTVIGANRLVASGTTTVAGAAGTLATTIIPSTAVTGGSILQDNGPHILTSTSQFRAQADATAVLSINATATRVL